MRSHLSGYLSRPLSGPALALLFILGVALNHPRGLLSSAGGSVGPFGEPLLRWLAAGILATAACAAARQPSWRRAGLTGLLAIILGAIRAAPGCEKPSARLPEGPIRLEAWVSEVPVVRTGSAGPQGPLGAGQIGAGQIVLPRTLFRTCEPELSVSVAAAVRWVLPGQKLLLEGRILPPRTPSNPGDLVRPGGFPSLWIEHAECIRSLDYNPLRRPVVGYLLLLRERFHRLIERLYPPETAGFLLAMLLGDRRLLPEAYRVALAETGTIHFLAISGLNVGIAMALVLRLPLTRRLRLPVCLGFLLGFTLITGGAPPVVRAAVMLSLHLAAEATGRAPRSIDTLRWAAAGMLAVEPDWVTDLGFWLSVSAVFAMIVWVPAIDGRVEDVRFARLKAAAKSPARSPAGPLAAAARALTGSLARSAGRSLAVSVATSAGTAPLILSCFYRVHPLGPLWNLFAGPIVTAILLSGSLALALGCIHPVVAVPPAWLAERLSHFLMNALEAFARVPGSCLYFPPPPAWSLALAGLALTLGAFPAFRRPALALILGLGVTFGLSGAFQPRPTRLQVLDVGNASCAVLEVPGAGAFLFDCGSGERRSGSGERIAHSILAGGLRRLQGVILSHPHADHAGALLEMARILPPEHVYLSPLFERSEFGRWLVAGLSTRGIPTETLARGQRLRIGPSLAIEVLQPSLGEELRLARNANEGSLVARVRIGENEAAAGHLLFPGDIEEEGLARLLGGGDDLRCDLLILPHHGRANRLLGELLDRVRPRWAVASGDGGGGGREVLEEVRRRGIAAAGTWEDGAVILRLETGAPGRPTSGGPNWKGPNWVVENWREKR